MNVWFIVSSFNFSFSDKCLICSWSLVFDFATKPLLLVLEMLNSLLDSFQMSLCKLSKTLFLKMTNLAFFAYLRSSHRRCSIKKDVLRNFTKLTGKHLCQRLLCFPVNFGEFLRKYFLQDVWTGRLLLIFLY